MGIASEQAGESSEIRLEGAIGADFAGESMEHPAQVLGCCQEVRISFEGASLLDGVPAPVK